MQSMLNLFESTTLIKSNLTIGVKTVVIALCTRKEREEVFSFLTSSGAI